MKITVEKITPHGWLDRACEFTSGKHVTIDAQEVVIAKAALEAAERNE